MLTADTITDEEIRNLRSRAMKESDYSIAVACDIALRPQTRIKKKYQSEARRRCADAINGRNYNDACAKVTDLERQVRDLTAGQSIVRDRSDLDRRAVQLPRMASPPDGVHGFVIDGDPSARLSLTSAILTTDATGRHVNLVGWSYNQSSKEWDPTDENMQLSRDALARLHALSEWQWGDRATLTVVQAIDAGPP